MIALAFYVCAGLVLLSALMVVIVRNPVHSVLWLILAFLSATALFVLLGAEFLAMLLMVVYVGAVAVLFLFVVMMLDVDFAALKEGAMKNLGFGIIIALLLGGELLLVAAAAGEIEAGARLPIGAEDNVYALGRLLYTDYALVFLGAGMVLFVAMIGAIALTMQHRRDVKRQNVLNQIYRDPASSVELVDVRPREGAS